MEPQDYPPASAIGKLFDLAGPVSVYFNPPWHFDTIAQVE
jgi:hypothetical protein